MKISKLIARLVEDGGSCLLAIDEKRAMHGLKLQAGPATVARPANGVAVIPLVGPITNRGPWGLEGFQANLAAAVADPNVGDIFLDVNTPGGTYAGTPEAAQAVAEANAIKPVTAVVNSLCASAGLLIVSQARTIIATPSSEVGSLGVLCVHMDFSAMLESDGIKPTIIRSVPNKAEGNPLEPLSAAALGNMTDSVAEAHDVFVRAVATGRKTSMANVNANFGQGRLLSAQKALQVGMIDKIGTMADALGGRGRRAITPRRSAFNF
jgi:capsid assembly protease